MEYLHLQHFIYMNSLLLGRTLSMKNYWFAGGASDQTHAQGHLARRANAKTCVLTSTMTLYCLSMERTKMEF